ncbi:MAG: LamG domain-containing protein [Phycisphaerae bacterium]|nr:LamG domain-containing protein [Phycisphaerae bacterium]
MTRTWVVLFIISIGSVQCGLALDFSDSFDSPHDFIALDISGTGWFGLENRQSARRVNASQDHAGQLFMAAEGDLSPSYGTFLYHQFNSDFVVSVKVTDFAGTVDIPVTGARGGLLIRSAVSTPQKEQWVTLDYAPLSSRGNGIRQAKGASPELTCTNDKLWNVQPFLQIERIGRLIFLRTGSDGVHWEDLPCSPVVRTDFVGQTLQVGLYVASTPDARGYIAFDDFYLSNRPDSGARPMQAYDPTPAHGSRDSLYSFLSWEPGLIAVAHNVWLGTSESSLSLIAQSLPRNECTLFYKPGFEPGVIYFWRVDEITSIQTTVQGDLWSFSVPGDQAFVPYPQDGQVEVIENNLTLTWAPGKDAIWHDIYFSQNMVSVQNGNTQAHQVRSTRAEFTPAVLQGQTTYYWRVDEIELDSQTRHVGPVWSFTTMPSATILDNNLRALWTWNEGQGTTAADTSGFRHHAQFMGEPSWVNGVLGTAIELDGIDDYAIASGDNLPTGDSDFTISAWIYPYVHSHTLLAWGSPQTNRANEIRLMQGHLCRHDFWGNQVTFETGSLANEWHHIAIGFNGLARNAYVDGAEALPVSSSDPLESPRVSASEIHIGASPWVAHDKYHGMMDEVRIYNKFIKAQTVRDLYFRAQWQASQPFPEDSSTVDVVNHLTWQALGTHQGFDVYFGRDLELVQTASTSDLTGTYLRRFNDPQADIALPAGTEGTYFWRVDTISENIVAKGHVWSFTMVKSYLIDGFETYTENSPYRIYQNWIDGIGFTDPAPGLPGNNSRAIVGYDTAPHTENYEVYSGNQAMPFRFLNADLPYYAEATRTFDLPEDWSLSDYKTLCLSFYGPKDNASLSWESLYLTLSDSQGHVTVQYPGPVSQYSDAQWHNWHIPLNSLVSLDLSDVTAVSIRMGDNTAVLPGSNGVLYIDELRLTAIP